jgi:hypothetical protein
MEDFINVKLNPSKFGKDHKDYFDAIGLKFGNDYKAEEVGYKQLRVYGGEIGPVILPRDYFQI